MSLVGLVLLVLSLDLHKHIVNAMHLMSQPSVFFAHIVLKINQLRSSYSLAYGVLYKMLRVNFLLHVVVVLIFVLVIHKHSRIDFMVHRRLLM